MTQTLITNATLLTDSGRIENCRILIDGAHIKAVGADMTADGADGADIIDVAGDIICPGFIDVQVNGGGGMLFNDDPSVETIRTIGAAHRTYGTTGFLPTLISDDLEKVKAAIDAVRDAINAGVPGVLGIHIEGPFLNTAKKGIHNAEKFRTLDDAAVALLSSLDVGVTHVTLAPELAEQKALQQLANNGVKIAAGHTAATYEDTVVGLQSGVTSFTHLYNAMTPLNSRAPGVVGAALEHKDSFAGIIVDGFHVHKGAVAAALQAKGSDKIYLVTDAMPCVGAQHKNFTLGGLDISVIDGKCTGPDGTLAGSDLDMIAAVRNTAEWLDIPLSEAIKMASATPAAFIGVEADYGEIAAGKKASLIRLDKHLNVTDSWIDGKQEGDK